MTTSTFNVRMDDELRAEATQIFAEYGLSPTQAVKLFFNQVVQTQKIPLRFDYKEPTQTENQTSGVTSGLIPNEETRIAMLEARQDYLAGKLERYNSVDDAINAMQSMAEMKGE